MERVKLFIPLIVFAILAGVFFQVLNTDDYNPQDLPSALIGQTLPEFSLSQLDKEGLINEKSIIGEVMLLNVWATWCISCRVEHAFLNQLKDEGVKIIGLDYKDEDDKANQWLQKLGNPYVINLSDPQGKLGLDLGVYGAPETYLIDKSGIIRYKHVGVIDDAVWQEKLQPLYQILMSEK